MARVSEFRILVASDGSLSGTAAAVTAKRFPWPARSRAYGVVSREAGTSKAPRSLKSAREQAVTSAAEITTKILVSRWSGVRVRVVDGPPPAAIIRAAIRARADVIVVGWRGHGVMRRLLSGSVSRNVVRAAPCSVLVVRRAGRQVRTLVIGVDGSPQSARAVEFAARLTPPEGGRMVLVTAAPLMSDASNPLLPSGIRKTAAAGVASINKRRTADARANLERLATAARSAGWAVDVVIKTAAPLESLLATVSEARADLLIVGATGTTELQRLLLGSVAQGAMDRSPVPVLIVR